MIPTTKPNTSPCDEMICYRRIKCSPLSQQQQVQQQQQHFILNEVDDKNQRL